MDRRVWRGIAEGSRDTPLCLRLVAVMYFNEPVRAPRQTSTPLLNAGIGAMAVATIGGGLLFAPQVFDLAERWYRALTVAAQVAGGA